MKYINSNIVIDKIDTEYNIQSSDYISKANIYIMSALRDIRVKQLLQPIEVELELNDYKAQLPDNIDKIYQVYINDHRATLDVKGKLKVTSSSNVFVSGFDGHIYEIPQVTHIVPDPPVVPVIPNAVMTEEEILDMLLRNKRIGICDKAYMYKINNGWIHTNVEIGTLKVLASAYPYTFDSDYQMLFPLIPNDENLINAITHYILRVILMRGYKHPILSLEKNNEFVNPAMSYERFKRRARNSCNSLSSDAKEALSRLLNLNVI